MPSLLAGRAARRAVAYLALSALQSPAALAAPPAVEFPVTVQQMQSLGVTLLKLEQPGAIAGMAYAAKVVLPPGQEQVVSAPVAGVVDQLLVGEQQAVKARASRCCG